MNPKQKRFAIEFLADGNATQAAIRAGYSEASAHTTGNRLLKNADVSKFIEQAQGEARDAATLNLEDTLLLLSSIALDPIENTRNRIAAISVLAKLNGWESPQRHEINVPLPADYDQVKAKFDLLIERKAKELMQQSM